MDEVCSRDITQVRKYGIQSWSSKGAIRPHKGSGDTLLLKGGRASSFKETVYREGGAG